MSFWLNGYKIKSYLLRALFKPVSDICARGQYYGITLWLSIVVVNELRQVKHLIEQRHPAIIVCVVSCNFLGCVVVAQFVRSWKAFGIISWQGSQFLRSWGGHSGSHNLNYHLVYTFSKNCFGVTAKPFFNLWYVLLKSGVSIWDS